MREPRSTMNLMQDPRSPRTHTPECPGMCVGGDFHAWTWANDDGAMIGDVEIDPMVCDNCGANRCPIATPLRRCELPQGHESVCAWRQLPAPSSGVADDTAEEVAS